MSELQDVYRRMLSQQPDKYANPHRRDERDYGDGGGVEEAVAEFLVGTPGWHYALRIATELQLDRQRLDAVLWRLVRRGKVQLTRPSPTGALQWRARA